MSTIKEGWGTKQGGMIKTWKKRWFVLFKGALVYYAKPGAEEKGRILIDSTSSVSPAPECKKQPAYKVITQERTYFINVETPAEVSEWVAAVSSAINGPSGTTASPAPEVANASAPRAQTKKVGTDDFRIIGVLGRGTYGKVQLVQEKATGKYYALKSMSKRLLADSDQVEQTITERNVLIQISHPFLVSAHYTFQTDTKIFMVLDYVPGGELFGRLKSESMFSESRARLYAAEILLGLGHLHSLGFIYRDLKPENILVDEKGHLKITDFGLAKNTDTTSTFCGTPEYIAPEMLQRQPYTKAVDWWSLGIILFEMLTGLPPFFDENVNMMYRSILRDEITFPSHVSPNARDLITQLLNRNPAERLGSGPSDFEEIKAHPFFAGLSWDAVMSRTIKPEWVPEIKNMEDTSMFDEEFTQEAGGHSFEDVSLIAADTQQQFQDFTLTQDSALADL